MTDRMMETRIKGLSGAGYVAIQELAALNASTTPDLMPRGSIVWRDALMSWSRQPAFVPNPGPQAGAVVALVAAMARPGAYHWCAAAVVVCSCFLDARRRISDVALVDADGVPRVVIEMITELDGGEVTLRQNEDTIGDHPVFNPGELAGYEYVREVERAQACPGRVDAGLGRCAVCDAAAWMVCDAVRHAKHAADAPVPDATPRLERPFRDVAVSFIEPIAGFPCWSVDNPHAPSQAWPVCPTCNVGGGEWHLSTCQLAKAAAIAHRLRTGHDDNERAVELAAGDTAPANTRNVAIKTAVLAVAGVSRCEVNEHGPARARAMTVSVWADVTADMGAILTAAEERADGMPFEVKVRISRSAPMPAAIAPADDRCAADAVMTSEQWSAAVRHRLAERGGRPMGVAVQTDADPDVDNFGDAT